MGFLSGVFGQRRSESGDYATFGEWALAIVRARPDIVSAEFDPTEFAITYATPAGGWGQISLATPYRSVSAAPADLAGDVLVFGLHRLIDNGEDVSSGLAWATVAPRLRPVIRQAGELATRVQGLSIAENTVWRPLLPCLMERVVIDNPTSMESVTPQHLANWGVDADTAFETARANMAELGSAIVDVFEAAEGLLYLADEDGEMYAGALPLAAGWIAALGAKAGALPIVFVPGTVGVFVGFATSPHRVRELVAVARGLFDDAARRVSPVPYTLDEHGRLIPFTVPRHHPAWPAIRSAEATLAAQVYATQHDGLRADLAAELLEDHAATLMHTRGADGIETTYAPWADTVPTLLPHAHNVTLTNVETGATFGVPWHVLATEVDLVPVPGLFPVRYRVQFHPGAQAMARMAAAQGLH
ncbi:hypothetical protein ACFVAV_05900 [Nocardia sp. NPDC057663]|uniref:hypothetical protein n=1 Tax=Nocardia sp. NPDC057663 TaxID=3346201 RepID=UPI00366E7572